MEAIRQFVRRHQKLGKLGLALVVLNEVRGVFVAYGLVQVFLHH